MQTHNIMMLLYKKNGIT